MIAIDTASELLEVAGLGDIQYFEVRARLKIGFNDVIVDKFTADLPATDNDDPAGERSDEELAGNHASNTDDANSPGDDNTEDGQQDWTFFVQSAPDSVNLRARLELETPDAAFIVDAAVFYTLAGEFEVSRQVLDEFVNRAAMLALYPFIREALHESARKIRARAPLLGIFNPAAMRIDMTPSGSEPMED